MNRILFLLLLFVGFQHGIFAQTNSDCPVFSVQEPDTVTLPGEQIKFKVIFSKSFDSSKLKFHWTVSAGEITEGQGTPLIIVKQMEAVTTTVELKCLP